jgi:hypothetical protein
MFGISDGLRQYLGRLVTGPTVDHNCAQFRQARPLGTERFETLLGQIRGPVIDNYDRDICLRDVRIDGGWRLADCQLNSGLGAMRLIQYHFNSDAKPVSKCDSHRERTGARVSP